MNLLLNESIEIPCPWNSMNSFRNLSISNLTYRPFFLLQPYLTRVPFWWLIFIGMDLQDHPIFQIPLNTRPGSFDHFLLLHGWSNISVVSVVDSQWTIGFLAWVFASFGDSICIFIVWRPHGCLVQANPTWFCRWLPFRVWIARESYHWTSTPFSLELLYL